MTNLKTNAAFDMQSNGQRVAVRGDWPQLVALIDKALATIPERERADLMRQWMPAHGAQIPVIDYAPLVRRWAPWLAALAVLVAAGALAMALVNRHLQTELARRERVIAADNLYPEFDLPDYGMLPASETYVAMMRADRLMIEDLRFSSEWRRRVDQSAQRAALTSVRRLDSFTRSLQERTHEHLGPPVVIGWTPPCLAHSTNWAIEVWLLVDFDGHRGRAHVFMVDSGTHEVTRELFTEVLLG